MATFLVTSTADSGAGSLRRAINLANKNGDGADTIQFDASLTGQSIFLQNTLTIKRGNVTIDGDIDGDGEADIFLSGDSDDSGTGEVTDLGVLVQVNSAADVTLSSLQFVNAFAKGANGINPGEAGEDAVAGIFNKGSLTIENSHFSGSYAYGGLSGGYTISPSGSEDAASATAGIYNSGTLIISDSYFEANHAFGRAAGASEFAAGDGGRGVSGILNAGNLEAIGVLFVNNYAFGGTGGYSYAFTAGQGGHAAAGIFQTSGNVDAIIGYSGGIRVAGAGGGTNLGTAGAAGSDSASIYQLGGTIDPATQAWNESVYNAFGTSGSNNIVVSSDPWDVIFGLDGDDTIDNSSGYSVTIRGGAGHDNITSTGLGTLNYAGAGDDSFVLSNALYAHGNRGNDIFHVSSFSGMGANGGLGNDTLIFETTGLNLSLDMRTGNATNGSTFAGFEKVYGINDAGFSDQIIGTNGADFISGRNGNDILVGGRGADIILGGDQDDQINGGRGNDTVTGGTGVDILRGNNGIDRLFGGDDGDLLDGGRDNDRVKGEAGADTIVYKKGYDRDTFLDFEDDIDTIQFSSNLKSSAGQSKASFLKEFAVLNSNGNVVFDFGNGDKLTVKGASTVDEIKNDMDFV